MNRKQVAKSGTARQRGRDLIERHAEPVEAPRGSRIVAFAWAQTDIDVPQDACVTLQGLRAPE
jgi:hypothetical protein